MKSSDRRIEKLDIITYLTGICLYLFLATWRIHYPGPYYDELLFVDAAASKNPTLFVHKSFLGIPILLMSYIGALKSWIYTPIFNLFGVSIYTIRLPMILLGICTLKIYFFIIKKLVRNTILFFFSFLILCSDPAFSFISRIDWGPNAIAHFLIALLLWQFLNYLKNGSPWILLGIIFTGLIGVFDKLNFIWFINGLIFAGIIFYYKEIWTIFRLNQRTNSLIILFSLILSAWLLIIWILPTALKVEGQKSFDLFAKAKLTYPQLSSTLTAQGMFEMVFARNYPFTVKLIIPATLGISILGLFFKNNKQIIFGRFCMLISICILVQILLTRSAGGPHHYLLIWPLAWLVILFHSEAILNSNRLFRVPVNSLLILLLSTNLIHGSYFFTQLNNPRDWNPKWSPAMYQLIKNLEQDPPKQIFCLDWGLGTSIKALANLPKDSVIHDIWPSFWKDTKESKALELRNVIKSKSSDLTKIKLIEFLPSQANKPEVHLNLNKLLQSIKRYKAQVSLIQLNGYGYLTYSFTKRIRSPRKRIK